MVVRPWRALLIGGYLILAFAFVVFGVVLMAAGPSRALSGVSGLLAITAGAVLAARCFAVRLEVRDREVLVVNHFRSHRFRVGDTAASSRKNGLLIVPTLFAQLVFKDSDCTMPSLATSWLTLAQRTAIISALLRADADLISPEAAQTFLEDSNGRR
jgi:hypothetical protein